MYEVLFGKLSYLGVKIDNIISISIFLHHKHLQIIRNNIDILILRTISSIINIINATILLQVGVDINIVILCMISLKSTSYSCSTDLLCFIAIINYLYEDGNLVLIKLSELELKPTRYYIYNKMCSDHSWSLPCVVWMSLFKRVRLPY